MRVRHKVPMIFTLSMVDMLCCAMGCVILLWLLNARQSEEYREETESFLAGAQSDQEKAQALLSAARGEQDKLGARVRSLLTDREKAAVLQARLEDQIRLLKEARATLQTQLTTQQALARDLEAKLKTSASRLLAMEADIRTRTTSLDAERKRTGGLDLKLTEAESALKGLRIDLDRARTKTKEELARAEGMQKTIELRLRDLAALTRSLEEAGTARKNLEKSLALRDKELKAAGAFKDKWEAAEERERFLAKQLKDRESAMVAATKTLETLEKEKLTLRAAVENRFAGIELTGRRVIFLVDMSGSMELLDEDTPAPQKWVEVRNTVARLMRSLPELEKYQIITFSSKSDFPLGSADKWLDHDPKTSPEKVLKALADVKPKGGTNMYAALESAFRYRADRLDTIYMLSDGLPNLGAGLTPAQAREMKEVERGAVLGKFVRATLKSGWNKPLFGRPRVRINTIGFFYESPDLGAFLWALARENDGSFVGMSKP